MPTMARKKAMIYIGTAWISCPNCGREMLNGDQYEWDQEAINATRQITCPNCKTVLTLPRRDEE